jgi:hypothetical protein
MRKLIPMVLVGAVLALCAGALPAQASGNNDQPRVVPVTGRPDGVSYREWVERWDEWVIKTPVINGRHPVLDPSGTVDCSVGQRGDVWFLAGVFGTQASRTCAKPIPAETDLFFPVINSIYFAFATDPDNQRTPAFCRSNSYQRQDVVNTTLSATIDGRPVENLRSFFVQSPFLSVQMPTPDPAKKLDNLVHAAFASPTQPITTTQFPGWKTVNYTCDAGFYLFVHGLQPGPHTLAWSATGPARLGSPSQQISYTFTVASE